MDSEGPGNYSILQGSPAGSISTSPDTVDGHNEGSSLPLPIIPVNSGLPALPALTSPEAAGCGHNHFSHRAAWLRAALLGVQDGLVSVSSLMIGVSAVEESQRSMLISGLAGLVAGACSMAIGEYISVYGQRDVEEADVDVERREFEKGPTAVAIEMEELTQIYVARGLSYTLARQVATELSAHDPVRAHARDELGIDLDDLANPGQAAIASAASFILGGVFPLVSAVFFESYVTRVCVVLGVSTFMFMFFGLVGAWLGGARKLRAATRCLVGGLCAIGITYTILCAFGGSAL